MASPARIREALIKVLSAKKANEAEIGSRKGAPPPPGFPTPNDPTANALRSDALSLAGARAGARDVQGPDPLAPQDPSPSNPAGKNLQTEDRHMIRQGSIDQDELTATGLTPVQGANQASDEALNALMNTIEDQAAKAGTEGVNPNLIRMLSERDPKAAVELMQRLRNQEFNPMMDDIPF
jgi:hypothetical protein